MHMKKIVAVEPESEVLKFPRLNVSLWTHKA